MNARPADASVEHVRLHDGTAAVTRPIRPGDAAALTRGLARLSPAGHAYRFLHYRSRFSEEELRYLTHCDFVNHIALILAILDTEGREIDQVGVARCIRDKGDATLAEVAIVVVDEWQRRGGGAALLHHLSRWAWDAGIRRWQAFSLSENSAAPKALSRVGKMLSRHSVSQGAEETIYELSPPPAEAAGGTIA